jgi:hypothetical protein
MPVKTKSPVPANRITDNGKTEPAAPEKEVKPAKAADKFVYVPAPNIARSSYAIIGTTPLVVHNMSQKAALEMLGKRFGKANVGKEIKDPEAEYNASRYISTDGWDGMHAGAFRAAMIGASRMCDGLPMTILKRLIFVIPDGESVPMTIPELGLTFRGKRLVRIIGVPKMRTDLVRIGVDLPDVRFRAEYWPWSAIINIEYNANRISSEQLASLLSLAGQHDGVGEGRPSAPHNDTGDCGMWKIKGL